MLHQCAEVWVLLRVTNHRTLGERRTFMLQDIFLLAPFPKNLNTEECKVPPQKWKCSKTWISNFNFLFNIFTLYISIHKSSKNYMPMAYYAIFIVYQPQPNAGVTCMMWPPHSTSTLKLRLRQTRRSTGIIRQSWVNLCEWAFTWDGQQLETGASSGPSLPKRAPQTWQLLCQSRIQSICKKSCFQSSTFK